MDRVADNRGRSSGFLYRLTVPSSWITVGLSAHRVETIEAAEAAMSTHRLVALEEPPTPGFNAMLDGRSSVEEHLEALTPEFPEYSRRQCAVLRDLHRNEVRIAQVEPFLAELEAVHELFDSGGRPEDVPRGTNSWRVYQAEKLWTGALLDYYAASASGEFDTVVAAVRNFARADAERGALRDAMRAQRIAALLTGDGGIYVEAGYVHAGLIGELRRRVPAGSPVRPRWLMAPVIVELSGRSHVFAPGDSLTLGSTPGRSLLSERARLLAAQSLIQVSISIKDEMLPSVDEPFPHTLDDVRSCQLVERLGYEDCRRLYPVVRSLPPPESRAVVERHIKAG